ncbi:MAG: hydantoinase/oxoprolinase N-terminal domain-containing protein [Anaerolineae bacterium]
MQRRYTIGIDIGGTFTDIACLDDQGQVYLAKADSTPPNFAQGVIKALEHLAEALNLNLPDLLAQTEVIKHATTVGTNALINRSGARVGFLTTKGFEDTTLIMRAIGRVAGLSEEELRHPNLITKPEPLAPRTLIRGIVERMDFRGGRSHLSIETKVRAAITELRNKGKSKPWP